MYAALHICSFSNGIKIGFVPAYIADFGMCIPANSSPPVYASMVNSVSEEKTKHASLPHLCPELYRAPPKKRIPYSMGTDVWSCGYLLDRLIFRIGGSSKHAGDLRSIMEDCQDLNFQVSCDIAVMRLDRVLDLCQTNNVTVKNDCY